MEPRGLALVSGSPRSARLHLVRHGAAAGVGGRAVGHTDPPLAEAGRVAVEALAATWRGPAPGLLLASDLARAAGSAAVLAAAWRIDAVTDPRLRELDFGAWDGRPWEEIHHADGERLARWGARWWEVATPGGEGWADLAERTLGWYRGWLAAEPPADTVVVTHGGPLRALLAHLLGLGRDRVWQIAPGHARVTSLELGGAAAQEPERAGRVGCVRLLTWNLPSFPSGAPGAGA